MIVLTVSLIMLGVISCSPSNKSLEEQTDSLLYYDETMDNGIIRMNSIKYSDSIKTNTNCYLYQIERQPDSTLPNVKDQYSELVYLDNRIDVHILKNGKEFFRHSFVKSDFKSFLDEGFMKYGILEGFVFDRTTGNSLRFATSVSFPQSDMYIPLIVTINNQGQYDIQRDNIMEEASSNTSEE